MRLVAIAFIATVVVVLTALLLRALFRPAREDPLRDRPIRDYRYTYHVAPEEWQYVSTQLAIDTSWVLLPQANVVSGRRPRAEAGKEGPRDLFGLRPETCAECHPDKYEEYVRTAHYRTMAEPTRDAVLGRFAEGQNRVETREPDLWFVMTAENDGLYQNVHIREKRTRYHHRERIDIAVGSGRHGQSYLYWKNDALFQLPISYLSREDSWANSPGLYTDGAANFARPVIPRCLDCHATWFEHVPNTMNRYDPGRYVLGITCARCHGDGGPHVEFHREHPTAARPRHIAGPATFSRERLNDICAQCHAGEGELLQPAFTYQPGQPLEKHLKLESTDALANNDPHTANQLARLRKSRCFQASKDLSCITCHDPHRPEPRDRQELAERCLQCHQPHDCGQLVENRERLKDFCTDCHLRAYGDTELTIQSQDRTTTIDIRDHFITIWPDETRRVLKHLLSAAEESDTGNSR